MDVAALRSLLGQPVGDVVDAEFVKFDFWFFVFDFLGS